MHLLAGGLEDELPRLHHATADGDHLRVEDVDEASQPYAEPPPGLLQHRESRLISLAGEPADVLAEHRPLGGEAAQGGAGMLDGHLAGAAAYGGAGGEGLETTAVAAGAAGAGGLEGYVAELAGGALRAAQEEAV